MTPTLGPLDEVARIAQEHGDYDDHNPTLWVHPVCDCKGRNGSHLTVCASLNTRSASRVDLLAALGAEWKCFEKWDTDDYPCPPDSTLHYGLCSWRVSPVEPVDE